MSIGGPRRASPPRGDGDARRARRMLGVPIPLVLVALLASAALGIVLAVALDLATTSRSLSTATSIDSFGGAGKNSSGLPVVSETTLGLEVQRLVDTGTIQPMTTFDAAQCLDEQDIPDSLLIMEEVAWGTEEEAAWLMVHGPMNRETLRANGGIVSATVVLPGCGTDTADTTPEEDLLWTGDVMIGSL